MGIKGDRNDNDLHGSLGGHLRDYYNKSSVIRKEGYGERNDDEFYADYTPKDITGSGKYYGKGPRNYVRSSEKIQEEICHIFTADRHLDASLVDVNVIGDEVHLEGYVESRAARWHAEDLATEVPGVKKVINQLRIRDAS